MGHRLSPLRRGLALGLALTACAPAGGVGPQQASRGRATESPSLALASDGSAISLPPSASLDHLDDGVPFIAGTGLARSSGDGFGAPPQVGGPPVGALLAGGREALPWRCPTRR